jgi:predicted lipoprotein with Yx(FWY)xxD motif
MSRLLGTAAIVAALAFAACGDEESDEPVPTAATSEQTTESPATKADKPAAEPQDKPANDKPGIEITVASSQFGDMLFDADKQAIYLFDKESTSKPECYGGCAAAWPPVLTKGEPVASGAAQGSLLGTTKRDDGSTQVTYDGQPLYYYAHEGPGQVLCHNVSEFGGLWLVVSPNGQAL